MKLSGVCAILYGVTWVAWLVVSAVATPWDPGDMGPYLLQVNADPTAYLVANWLAVISHVVGLPVALGFYQVLRRWGAMLWVGVLALVLGSLFFIAANIMFRAFAYELGSRYVAASEATRPALEVLASTLYQTGLFLDLIAHELFFSIGIGLFSLHLSDISGAQVGRVVRYVRGRRRGWFQSPDSAHHRGMDRRSGTGGCPGQRGHDRWNARRLWMDSSHGDSSAEAAGAGHTGHVSIDSRPMPTRFVKAGHRPL